MVSVHRCKRPASQSRTISPRSVGWLILTAVCINSILCEAGLAQEKRGRRDTAAPTKNNVPATEQPPPNPNAKTNPEWIWNATDDLNAIPPGDSFFRRVMDLPETEKGIIEFEADDQCEVFLNGRRIGTTKAKRTLERIDVSTTLRPGNNILAIRVTNRTGTEAGLKVGFMFKPKAGKWRIVVSDTEWKASKIAGQNWQLARFDDSQWLPARSLSAEPETPTKSSEPIVVSLRGNETESTATPNAATSRFQTQPGFVVDELLDHETVGSLVAMTFNEFGHIIASRESGPLILIYDSNKDGKPDKIRTYCELVKNIQGILALNGDVYVTGDGPDGSGLYRLVDEDRNGELEQSELLVKFKGTPGEHGPHQIAFGPDGSLYVVIGNHAQVDAPIDQKSTYRLTYEGDLVQPRFEDPGGHAEGVKAPGGTVIRYELATKSVQVVAGGLRNAFDLVFHPNGMLYVHDSDMEADIGSVWHRATGVFRVVEGAEFGWRSGWANWPEFYPDRLPSIGSAGRGSPTGMAVYNHFMFPSRYHRSLFLADWSEGRIVAMNVDGNEKTKGRMEDFVVGSPMNVTDLEVSPDGSLYFCTGGRGTDGGLFRIRWIGEIPDSVKDLGEGITKAIRQPQFYSAFGRQAAAVLKKEIGEDWNELIAGVAYSSENPAKYRIQALDMMQLLGPMPTTEMLIELSNSSSDQLRIKCTRLLALRTDDADAIAQLRKLLGDSSSPVRIAACEALLRLNATCEVDEIKPFLQSESREERFVGRRLLAKIPSDQWRNDLLNASTTKTIIHASLALITSDPSNENAGLVIDAMTRLSEGFVSDADFVDLLRVLEVTLHLSNAPREDVPSLVSLVEKEFPAGNAVINGELVRLATYLQIDIVPQAIKYLQLDVPMPERMLISMHLPLIKHEWTSTERMSVLQFLETAQRVKSGGSYPLYIMRTSQAMSDYLTEEESLKILELGEQYPNAALSALYKTPEQLNEEQIQTLIKLDTAIDKGGIEDDVFKRLKTGITAVLSRQENDVAIEHLRQRWRKSPDRRATIAMALSQKPDERNWDYLVRSIGLLDLFAVPEVCNALRKIDVATEDPEALRQTILQGCKLVAAGQSPQSTIQLLEYWTGEKISKDIAAGESPMAPWQKWYEVRFPDLPPAVLPNELEQPRWSLDFLEQYLVGDQGKTGSRENGATVFAKARCNSCHKLNSQGTGFGPDLTNITKRFTRTEFLESTLFPSHVISDQYASKKVLTTTGDVYTGIMVQTPKGVTIRASESKDFVVPKDEIEEILPSKVSAMPSGLFDKLTPTEIRDLMCYVGYIPQNEIAEEKPTTVRR